MKINVFNILEYQYEKSINKYNYDYLKILEVERFITVCPFF